ncbi:NADPH-dependent F420 reductase [Sphingopyxis sp. MG]|uniref:NADPH-dependent F420 reductase n=1 Tax=Sphingopyxis sp. MG TaxID=1866325 RepID=UPI000CDF4828|nr:NADPH-dependent F420 reductase [Sphingopyxis sp. MG]AVA14656.1 NADPH-dependent F420 reductase [Sphingopyxis sp. MG]
MNDRIAILGGTGNLGAAIARRLAKAGRNVTIGSRSRESAERVAAEIGFGLQGADNLAAVQAADVVFLTVPFAAQAATLSEVASLLEGKLLIDTTVPLVPPKVMRVQLPEEGSAALRAQQLVGEQATVVSAFHNVAAHKLMTDDEVACDVLVFGDERDARDRVIALALDMGLRGLHGGALANSAAAEALTSVLIFLNKTYQADGAGICITGIPISREG